MCSIWTKSENLLKIKPIWDARSTYLIQLWTCCISCKLCQKICEVIKLLTDIIFVVSPKTCWCDKYLNLNEQRILLSNSEYQISEKESRTCFLITALLYLVVYLPLFPSTIFTLEIIK